METPLRETPLQALHVAHGARLVPFAGWRMPVQYTSIMEEHRAVRTSAGLFDVSHMGEVSVTGPATRDFLNHLLTQRFDQASVGRAIYSLMCQPDGGVIDDLIVYLRGDTEALLCVNAANEAKDGDWIEAQAAAFEVEVAHVSAQYALLALQGPQAPAILQELTESDLGQLKRFRCQALTIAGKAVFLARTGYTGEDGFELFLSPADATPVAEALLQSRGSHGLVWAGLGARDSLRLEMGYPLYGHELSAAINPLMAGLEWTIKWERPRPFIGQEALAAQKAAGLPAQVRYFRLADRRIAREGAPVFAADAEVGRVLSGTMSPMLGRPIGSALIETAALAAGAPLEVDLRGKRYPLELAQPPLHQD